MLKCISHHLVCLLFRFVASSNLVVQLALHRRKPLGIGQKLGKDAEGRQQVRL